LSGLTGVSGPHSARRQNGGSERPVERAFRRGRPAREIRGRQIEHRHRRIERLCRSPDAHSYRRAARRVRPERRKAPRCSSAARRGFQPPLT